MNVLLATSAAPPRSPFATDEKRMPLGVASLIAVLRKAGHTVRFIDAYLRPSRFLEEGVLDDSVDVFGVYSSTICFRDTLRMFEAARRLRETGAWHGKIAVGGPHTSATSGSIPEYVDHICYGEGERAILKIADGAAPREIAEPFISELDELPRPAYDVLAPMGYDLTAPFGFPGKTFTMNTSRGCPFSCRFCSTKAVWGRTYRTLAAEAVLDTIRYLVSEFGASGIYFREDHFTLSKARLESVCTGLVRDRLDIHWHCETRVDCLDRETLQLMARSGCRSVYIGAESGSPRMLERLRKGVTVEQTESVIRWCHQLGVRVNASFLFNLPGETEDDRRATERLIRRSQPEVAWRNVFVGIPGSDLYEEIAQSGRWDFVDKTGLIYLPGHDAMVDRYYGGAPRHKIPDRSERGKPVSGDQQRPVGPPRRQDVERA